MGGSYTSVGGGLPLWIGRPADAEVTESAGGHRSHADRQQGDDRARIAQWADAGCRRQRRALSVPRADSAARRYALARFEGTHDVAPLRAFLPHHSVDGRAPPEVRLRVRWFAAGAEVGGAGKTAREQKALRRGKRGGAGSGRSRA